MASPVSHGRSALERLNTSGVSTKPTAALRETYPRLNASNGALNVLTSGTLCMQSIPLLGGDVVTNISTVSANTRSGNHFWYALFTPARVRVGITANQTTTTWAAGSLITLALTSAYTVPADGLYYIGILDSGATPQQFRGFSPHANLTNLAPVLFGNTTDTGLTDPASAPATAGAITGATAAIYGYVS